MRAVVATHVPGGSPRPASELERTPHGSLSGPVPTCGFARFPAPFSFKNETRDAASGGSLRLGRLQLPRLGLMFARYAPDVRFEFTSGNRRSASTGPFGGHAAV